jgi:hypothetical protein
MLTRSFSIDGMEPDGVDEEAGVGAGVDILAGFDEDLEAGLDAVVLA